VEARHVSDASIKPAAEPEKMINTVIDNQNQSQIWKDPNQFRRIQIQVQIQIFDTLLDPEI